MIRRRHRDTPSIISTKNEHAETGLPNHTAFLSERNPPRPVKLVILLFCLVSFCLGCWWRQQQQNEDEVVLFKEMPTPVTQSLENVTTKIAYYSRLKNDRSGSVIDHMLRSFGYAYLKRQTYMGACGYTRPDFMENHKRLLASIGLDKLLPFACPNETAVNPNDVSNKMMFLWESRDSSLRQAALENGWDAFDAWVTYLKQNVAYLPASSSDNHDTIVVHIRRGDITPCCHKERYFPNLYYTQVIDENLQEYPNAQVIIFSEEQSYESFDEFRERGYQVNLGGDLADVWKIMISSTVLILSQSDFSKVPELLTRGVIGNNPWSIPEPLKQQVNEVKERFWSECNGGCRGVELQY